MAYRLNGLMEDAGMSLMAYWLNGLMEDAGMSLMD